MIFKKISTSIIIVSLFVLNVFGKNNSKNQSPVTDEQKNWISENKAIVIGLPAALLTGYILGLKINSNNDSSPEHKKALKNLKDLSDKVQQLETSVTNKEDIIKQLKLAGNNPLKIADLTKQLKNKEAEITKLQEEIAKKSQCKVSQADLELWKQQAKDYEKMLHQTEEAHKTQNKLRDEEHKRQLAVFKAAMEKKLANETPAELETYKKEVVELRKQLTQEEQHRQLNDICYAQTGMSKEAFDKYQKLTVQHTELQKRFEQNKEKSYQDLAACTNLIKLQQELLKKYEPSTDKIQEQLKALQQQTKV